VTTAAHEWPWERMAESNASSHELLIDVLAPQPGERFLDVGTGAGGVAIRAARAGASAVGVDIASEAIEQARRAAAEEGVEVEFDVGDAAALPYQDESFDVVASAFGVNFTRDHARAAEELARVSRAGARLGLTLMPRESRAAELWTLVRRYGAGANGDHPADFSERLDELLGESFAFESRLRESPPGHASTAHEAWEFFVENFGPLKDLATTLDASRLDEVRAEFEALRERWGDRPATSVLVLGTRQ
jgi:SAM-dependent methyltransferase